MQNWIYFFKHFKISVCSAPDSVPFDNPSVPYLTVPMSTNSNGPTVLSCPPWAPILMAPLDCPVPHEHQFYWPHLTVLSPILTAPLDCCSVCTPCPTLWWPGSCCTSASCPCLLKLGPTVSCLWGWPRCWPACWGCYVAASPPPTWAPRWTTAPQGRPFSPSQVVRHPVRPQSCVSDTSNHRDHFF